MSTTIHDLLDQVIPRPLFFILSRFSNLMYKLVLGASNNPSSWWSTLLPPLIAIGAFYFTMLMVYRTVQSTVQMAWWSVKWGAIAGIVLYAYAWYTGDSDAMNSTGDILLDQTSGSGWLGRAARELPGATPAVAGMAAWLPMLMSQLRTDQQPGQANGGRRNQRNRRQRSSSADSEDGGDLAEGISRLARWWGRDAGVAADVLGVGGQDARGEASLLRPLLQIIGLGGAAEAETRGTTRNTRSSTRRRRQRDASSEIGSDREWNSGAFDLGLDSDTDHDDDFDDDHDFSALNARFGPPSSAASNARRRAQRQRRQAEADAARRGRGRGSRRGASIGTAGGAADVDNTRREIGRALQGIVRDLFG